MAFRQRYAGPAPTHHPTDKEYSMMGYNKSPQPVGGWHPTVLYLVGLILAEIAFVAIVRKYPLPNV